MLSCCSPGHRGKGPPRGGGGRGAHLCRNPKEVDVVIDCYVRKQILPDSVPVKAQCVP